MKRFIKKITAIFLITCILILSACSASFSDNMEAEKTEDTQSGWVGKYIGNTILIENQLYYFSDVYSEGANYLELEPGGVGKLVVNDVEQPIRWLVDEEQLIITILIGDKECEGAFSDDADEISIDFGLMRYPVNMTFIIEGKYVPASTKETETTTTEGELSEDTQ